MFLVFKNTNKTSVLSNRSNTRKSVWSSISNKSVFKEKIEMKVGLILCKCYITYPNSVSVLISFVFFSWIINEFEMKGSNNRKNDVQDGNCYTTLEIRERRWTNQIDVFRAAFNKHAGRIEILCQSSSLCMLFLSELLFWMQWNTRHGKPQNKYSLISG